MQNSFSDHEAQDHHEDEQQWEEEGSHQENIENEDHGDSAQRARSDTKRNSSYSYQNQKIIMNDLEDDEPPTYSDFLGNKPKDVKAAQNDEEDFEDNKVQKTPRWEILYGRAKEAKAAKEELRKQYESQQTDPECTFRPKILTTNNNRLLFTTEPTENEFKLSIHERTKMWQSRVENKLLESREMFKDQDMIGCTFQPDLTRSNKEHAIKGLSRYGTKGVESYLRRRIIANQQREEKEKILENPLAKLPSHVYKKEGNITIPKGPDFSKGKTMEINSLKKPMEFPTPKTDRYSTLENISPERTMSPQKASTILVDPIHVKNVKFGDAIQKLHRELHRMNIN